MLMRELIFHLDGVQNVDAIGVLVPAEQHGPEGVTNAEIQTPKLTPMRRYIFKRGFAYHVLRHAGKDCTVKQARLSVDTRSSFVNWILLGNQLGLFAGV